MKTHISLNVSNVENSIEFYKKMLGVEPLKAKADYAKFDVANPPLNLTMNQVNFERGGSLSHLGLQVETTEEVLEMGKRWQENGLITLDEMKTDCCYALQDKTWVEDPDGNRWEVFVVLGDTTEKDIAESACCATVAAPIGIQRNTKSCS
ncbi:MAG TPA: ArsI/CadI family heavy metal resistance metalloenzyme [Pyrinomonadaceae bacterium]|nr:ArsI/CadI family heavy metal resistance metalloenzyme [Pyrinomonadaceae bacterium]